MLDDEDKAWLRLNCGKVERFFLYVMVFISMVSSCNVEHRITEIQPSTVCTQK